MLTVYEIKAEVIIDRYQQRISALMRAAQAWGWETDEGQQCLETIRILKGRIRAIENREPDAVRYVESEIKRASARQREINEYVAPIWWAQDEPPWTAAEYEAAMDVERAGIAYAEAKRAEAEARAYQPGYKKFGPRKGRNRR